jgi:hypothetical protein
MTACYYNNARQADMLITSNANLDLVDLAGNTAMQIALENSNNECVELLLNEMGSPFVHMLYFYVNILSKTIFTLGVFI